MKKILAITYNFHPDTSPTAFCLELVLKQLSNNYNITIVTSTKNKKHNKVYRETYEGMEVIRYFDIFAYTNDVIRKRPKNKGKKIIWIFVRFLSSIINRIYYSLYPDGGFFWRKNALKRLKKEVNLEQYRIIMASTGLYSTQVLAKLIKNQSPNIKLVSYLNDPLPINNPFMVDIFHIFNNYKLSLECIKDADIIIANSSLYGKYARDIFRDFKFKIFEVDIPLLIELDKEDNHTFELEGDKNSLKLVYTGSLYKNIRNPEYMLKTLTMANQNKYTIHIIGNLHDCEDIVMKYKEMWPEVIFVYGQLERREAVAAIKSANILLNIGNNLSDQVPSKIFEYMGTGKPIIHYYYNSNDTSLSYLQKYEFFYGIINNIEQSQLSLQELNEFITKNSNVVIPYEGVKNRLMANTPQYAGEIIDKIIRMTEVK